MTISCEGIGDKVLILVEGATEDAPKEVAEALLEVLKIVIQEGEGI